MHKEHHPIGAFFALDLANHIVTALILGTSRVQRLDLNRLDALDKLFQAMQCTLGR